MKYTSEEWIVLLENWQIAQKEYEQAKKERERLFVKAKTWLGLLPEFGNLSTVEEMLYREIGIAIVEERKP